MKRLLNICCILCLLIVTGCASNKDQQLYDYKTKYVGEAWKVSHIVRGFQYPNNVNISGIEIQSEKEPYGITVLLNTNNTTITDHDLFKQAVGTFALIDNLGTLSYYDNSIDTVVAVFTKETIDLELKKSGEKDTKKIGSSKKQFTEFLEKDLTPVE